MVRHVFPPFYSIKGNSHKVSAKNGAVAARHPLTATVGVEVLKKGGNAVDAAVSSALTACVVEPYMVGIGGGGDAVMYLSQSRESASVDFWGVTPSKMKPNYYEVESIDEIGDPIFGWAATKNDANLFGHTSVVVPGMIAGLSEMLEKYGTISLKDALQPAIEYAEQGIILDLQLSTIIGYSIPTLTKDSGMAKTFLKDGVPPAPWSFKLYQPEKLVQKDLASTLRKIAKGGPDAFYRGEIAKAIARDMEKHRGLIDEAELARYRPYWEKAILGNYRGHQIIYPPGTGGTTVMEILNILEEYDLGKHSPVHVDTLHTLIRAVLLGFADMLKSMGGEPTRSSLEKLASKEHATRLRNRKKMDRSNKKKHFVTSAENTTNITVVDKERNTVSISLSLGLLFGAGVMIPGTGIHLNDAMGCSDPVPGRSLSIRPGKRQFIPTSSTVVLKDGRPFLTTGGLGGCRIITAVVKTISNVVDHKLDILEAQESPRVAQAGRDTGPTFVDSRVPISTVTELRKRGDDVVAVDTEFGFGLTTGLLVDWARERIEAASERAPPYGFDGAAIGY